MSESVEKPGWRIPRWILEVWLWASVPTVVLEWIGCPIRSAESLCLAVGTSWLPMFLDLAPMNLGWFITDWPMIPALIALTVLVLVCHRALRRFAPARMPLPMFLGVAVGWLALSAVTMFLGITNLVGASPIGTARLLLHI